MRTKLLMWAALLLCVALSASAQQSSATQDAANEQRVGLEEQAIALDSTGQTALSGQLLTKALSGTPDAPVRNARFLVENRSPLFYTYVSGAITFYDDRGVRCGEGAFTLNALAPGEQAEVDAPGLRIVCAPRAWRLVAYNLLTRTTDAAKPAAEQSVQPASPSAMENMSAPPTLEITVNDKVYSAPLGSTLDVPVRNRRARITVRAAP